MKLLQFFSLTILLAGTSSSIWSTVTRSRGMGLTEDTSWMVDKQYPYLFLNPAAVNQYKNFVYFEHQINSASEEENSGGLFFNPYKKLVFGFLAGLPTNDKIFNDSANPRSMFFSSGNKLISNNVIFDLNNAIISANGLSLAESFNVFDVSRNKLKYRNISTFVGYTISDFEIGGSFSYGFVKDIQLKSNKLHENITLFKSETNMSIGVNYTRKILFFRSFDLAYSLSLYNLDNRYQNVDISGFAIEASLADDGAQDHSIFFQTRIRVQRRHLLHLSYRFKTLRTSTTARAKSEVTALPNVPFEFVENYMRTGTSQSIGLSDEMTPVKTVRVFFGFQLELESLQNNYDGRDLQSTTFRQNPVQENYDFIFLPVYLGLEGDLSKYFTIRFALSHSIRNKPDSIYNKEVISNQRGNVASANITATNITTTTGSGAADSTVSLGFTIKFSSVAIDWLANANFFKEGPTIFSGKVNELSTALAVSYYFAEQGGKVDPQ